MELLLWFGGAANAGGDSCSAERAGYWLGLGGGLEGDLDFLKKGILAFGGMNTKEQLEERRKAGWWRGSAARDWRGDAGVLYINVADVNSGT